MDRPGHSLYGPLNHDASAAVAACIRFRRCIAGESVRSSAMRACLMAADTAAGEGDPEKRRLRLRRRNPGDHDSAFVASQIGLLRVNDRYNGSPQHSGSPLSQWPTRIGNSGIKSVPACYLPRRGSGMQVDGPFEPGDPNGPTLTHRTYQCREICDDRSRSGAGHFRDESIGARRVASALVSTSSAC